MADETKATAPAEAGSEADTMDALKERTERYGAGFAVASEAFSTRSADMMVLGAKVVIGAIVVYALVGAVWVGVFGG
jgi:cobalamin biosynthesis Mg chelatase CobN